MSLHRFTTLLALVKADSLISVRDCRVKLLDPPERLAELQAADAARVEAMRAGR